MSTTRRIPWGWDAAVAGSCLVVASIVGFSEPHEPDSWATIACIACLLLSYVLAARPALSHGSHMGLAWWAATLLIAATVLATWFTPVAATLQAIVYPLLWSVSLTTRSAITRSAILAVGIAVATGTRTGSVPAAFLAAALTLAFTIALGLWITGIARYGTERDRLLTELRAAQDEVASLERQAGITEERARVAREIHDTIAQSLTGLVMTAQRARTVAVRDPESLEPTLGLIESLATEALAEARSLVAAYTPVSVSGGLSAALTSLGDRFTQETGVVVTVGGEATIADREAEVVLLRCAQEALANVRKHAHAKNVTIGVRDTDQGPELTVTDDGVGIDDQASGGYGLAGMAERVRIAGGTLHVGPVAAGGTVVQVVLPGRSANEVVA